MRHSLFHLVVTLPLLLVSAAPRARAAAAPELLYYRAQRPNDRRYYQVTLRADGSGNTVLVGKKTVSSSFALTPAELTQLKDLVRKSGFFKLLPGDPPGPPAPTVHLLRVALDGQKRELKYGHRNELDVLGAQLGKLVQQGSLLQGMSSASGVHAVVTALGMKADERPLVQPEVFRKPLEEHLNLVVDGSSLSQALQALATIAPPAEWSDIIAKQLTAAHEPRRTHLLWAAAQVAHGGAPDAHRAAVAPLLSRVLGSEYSGWASAAKEKQDALYWMVIDLGDLRYAPAIPALVTVIRKLPEKQALLAAGALPKIGDPAAHAIAQLLDDPSPRLRSAGALAARTLVILSRNAAAFPAGQEKERDALRRSVDADITPRLRKLAQSDPNSAVRARAAQALHPTGPEHR